MRFAEKVIARNKNKTGTPPATIAFLGDSVTQGCFEVYQCGENAVETDYRYKDGYVEQFRGHVMRAFPMAMVNVINAGISGDTAPGGAARLARDVLPFSPDLVVVCFGLNDSGHGLSGIPAYQNALRHLLTQLRAQDIEAILLTPNMCCTYPSYEVEDGFLRGIAAGVAANQISGVMDAYIDAAREVATALQVPICDVYAKWKKLYESGADVTRMLANRINHPTPEMNDLFARSLFDMLFLSENRP